MKLSAEIRHYKYMYWNAFPGFVTLVLHLLEMRRTVCCSVWSKKETVNRDFGYTCLSPRLDSVDGLGTKQCNAISE